MTTTVSISQDDVFTALRAFIQGVISCEVVQGLGNGTPMPLGGFIAMTALPMQRIGTNRQTYTDPVSATGTANAEQHIQYTIQLDCYGPSSSDWAVVLSTLLRDEYGCNALAPTVQPLYVDDPKMIAMVDGEEQYEQRWMVGAVLQYNPVVQTPMQFMAAATIGLVDVDAAYPPA
jgi:hypothetical protein